jgi:hypothetical protein
MGGWWTCVTHKLRASRAPRESAAAAGAGACSLEQFEKIFDQVVATLRVEDIVGLILVPDFVLPQRLLSETYRIDFKPD